MAVFDYTGTPMVLTIKNAIDAACCKYRACDAGTPVQKVEAKYDDIKDKPGVKFDYIFNPNGSFKTDEDDNYVVLVYQKFKNTDRKVPAYRTFNGKVLKAGDEVSFVTDNKDEIVFYEKLAEAFGSKLDADGNYTGGELTLTFGAAAADDTTTDDTTGA